MNFIYLLHIEVTRSYRVDKAVVAVLLSIQHPVFNKDRDGSQDERDEQVHVDEVPGAVQLPVKGEKKKIKRVCYTPPACVQKDS